MTESDPAVLLHAGPCDHHMWDDVVPALHDAGRTVVAPDLRGFGTRPPGHGPFSHAGDVLALLDGLGVDEADLVGASFGGRVALQVAATAPDRVRSLALLAPALPGWESEDPDLIAYGEQEEALWERGDFDAVATLNADFWGERLSPSDREYVLEAQRRAFALGGDEDAEQEPEFDAGRITARSYVVVGDGDKPDFVAIARHLADTLPEGKLDVVAGAGHLLALERPEEIGALLAAWLRREE